MFRTQFSTVELCIVVKTGESVSVASVLDTRSGLGTKVAVVKRVRH